MHMLHRTCNELVDSTIPKERLVKRSMNDASILFAWVLGRSGLLDRVRRCRMLSGRVPTAEKGICERQKSIRSYEHIALIYI